MFQTSIDMLVTNFVPNIDIKTLNDNDVVSATFTDITNNTIMNYIQTTLKDIPFKIDARDRYTEVRLIDNYVDEQLFLMNVPPFTYNISLKFNPKRIRGNPLLQTLITNIFTDLDSKIWKRHFTRIDIAIDVINEPNSSSLRISKLAITDHAYHSGQAGQLTSIQFGSRASKSMLRIYDKRVKTIDDIKRASSKMIHNIYKEYLEMFELANNSPDDDWSDENFIIDHFNLQDTLTNHPEFDADIMIPVKFQDLLRLKKQDEDEVNISNLPDNWHRLEIELHTKRIENNRIVKEFVHNDWLQWLDTPSYNTINDPLIRALMLAIQAHTVSPKELSRPWHEIYKAVKKYSDVTIYRRAKGYVEYAQQTGKPLPSGAIVLKQIKRLTDTILIDQTKLAFNQALSNLNAELEIYI